MKKNILFGIFTFFIAFCKAKEVKFMVDMQGQTISPNGIHVSGDFQNEAGFPVDWDSKSTSLTKEAGTNIYSVIVSIPAFRTYQYKFVNGDQFYEVEFVPEKSRVGFDFNDNRWIYVDSLSDDTLVLPPLVFGENAPAGKRMIRYKVDLSLQNTIHNKGIHISSSFNNQPLSISAMVSFSDKMYEYINYTDSNEIEYIFLNGTLAEQVNSECSNANNKRFMTLMSDTVLNEVCYNECKNCTGKTSQTTSQIKGMILFPNPTTRQTTLKFIQLHAPLTLAIKDMRGVEIKRLMVFNDEAIIDTQELMKGVYLIEVIQFDNQYSKIKLTVN